MAIRTTKKREPVRILTQEDQIARIVVDTEYSVGKTNVAKRVSDLESAIDMLECERTEKNADWNSDIFFPEFTAQILTQSSLEADKYFQTRDYVEVYLEDGSPEAVAKAEATKELINRTLNQRHLNYYMKFMRSNIMKNLGGEVFAKCGWEREVDVRNMPVTEIVESDVDEFGNPIVDRTIQVPRMEEVTRLIPQPIITKDRFNFEVIDRRNIFMDNSYVYSLQDKKWVIIREEKTLAELLSEAEFEGYINLDKLTEVRPDIETDTARESYNKDDQEQGTDEKWNKPFDIIHRYGKFYAKVKSRDSTGNPVDISYGIDNDGKPYPDADLIECIISFALSGSTKQLIRFIPTPCIDVTDNFYRPLIRGLCYIHPTKDWGLGDGKFARELQIGINDTFNISNDRVMLATLPTLKGRKYSVEDNPYVYIEPGHIIPVENPDDLIEFKISDNIEGALNQIGVLRQAMSGVTSIFPPALGNVPELASTTATAVAGAEQSKSSRANYKALTFEHTFLNELYWMITQLTYQFATENTAKKLMGDKVYDFDPRAEFSYKPLSASIESEYSKANQIKELSQLIGYVAPMGETNPKAAVLVNYMMAKIFRLFGDEHEEYAKVLLDENAPIAGQMPSREGMPVSNQMGMAQSGMEQAARGT